MTKSELKSAIERIMDTTDYTFYGIRADTIPYTVGDTLKNSHNLFQYSIYDEDRFLIYPETEDDLYGGVELDGVCAIRITREQIDNQISLLSQYFGDYLHVIGSNYGFSGEGIGEIILQEATVLFMCLR